jgi:hypothetical protein
MKLTRKQVASYITVFWVILAFVAILMVAFNGK